MPFSRICHERKMSLATATVKGIVRIQGFKMFQKFVEKFISFVVDKFAPFHADYAYICGELV